MESARKFLTIPEVADHLRCGRTKAYEMVNDGTLPSLRISGLLRVPATALDALEKQAMAAARESEADGR
jgi:excisionase family DNA binding protein